MDAFKLEIALGNEGMADAHDVAVAIRQVADTIDAGHDAGTVRDINGNTVGTWELA